jgi:hypothetical protein
VRATDVIERASLATDASMILEQWLWSYHQELANICSETVCQLACEGGNRNIY